jgi:hypothetical protein
VSQTRTHFRVSNIARSVEKLSALGVPYEKGFALLFYLEGVVGDAEFAEFLKAYVKHYKVSFPRTRECAEVFHVLYFAYRGELPGNLLVLVFRLWLI